MTKRPAAARFVSIDVLRTIAIVLMTVVHFVENLAVFHDIESGPFIGANRYWWMPAGFAAPLFTFLSGVSYWLWADARASRGCDTEETSKITIRRGLFLILFGFAFNVLVWMPEDVFDWGILTLIGTGMLALDIARRNPTVVSIVACGLFVGLAPTLRGVAHHREFWADGYYDYHFTFTDVAADYLMTGHFPVFPWLALPLAGFVAAPSIFRRDTASPSAVIVGGLLLAAAAVTMVARPLAAAHLTTHDRRLWAMFPPTTAHVVGTIGGVILLAAFLHRVLDRRADQPGALLRVAGAMSRHSLSLYILHHVAHIWPLWLVGLVMTGDPQAFWQVAMPASAAIAWGVAFMLLVAWLAERMDRPGTPSAESLLRWLCEP